MSLIKHLAITASTLYLSGCASFINGGPLDSELAAQENPWQSPKQYAKLTGQKEVQVRAQFDSNKDGELDSEELRNLNWYMNLIIFQREINEKSSSREQ